MRSSIAWKSDDGAQIGKAVTKGLKNKFIFQYKNCIKQKNMKLYMIIWLKY